MCFKSEGDRSGIPPPDRGGMSTIRDRLFQKYFGDFSFFHDEIDTGFYSHDVGNVATVKPVDPYPFGMGQLFFGVGIQGLFIENILDGCGFIRFHEGEFVAASAIGNRVTRVGIDDPFHIGGRAVGCSPVVHQCTVVVGDAEIVGCIGLDDLKFA